MVIQCPDCNAKYNVPDGKIKGVTKFKCSKCLSIFTTQPPKDDSVDSQKDTARISTKKEENDSLWSDENLALPEEKKISIAVIKGARSGYIYQVTKPYILIGRGKVDLIIPDKEISRKHVAIEIRDEQISLRDLGSTNGTFINNQKISIIEINDQTEFRIGQTTLMLIATSKEYSFES